MAGEASTSIGYTTGATNMVFRYAVAWESWTTATTATTYDLRWSTWTSATSGGEAIIPTTRMASRTVGVKKQALGAIYSLAEYKERIATRKAKAKGLDLLHWLLTPEQSRELRRYDSVRFRGSNGGLYECGLGAPQSIFKLSEEGEVLEMLGVCQTGTGYVAEDRIGAIILAFQTNEAEARQRAANHTAAITESHRRKLRARRYFRVKAAA